MVFRHFCITLIVICALISVYNEDWTAFCYLIIALIVNGIYLIDARINELKK